MKKTHVALPTDLNEEEKGKINIITTTAASLGVTVSEPIRVTRGPAFSCYELTADTVEDKEKLMEMIDDFGLYLADCIRMPRTNPTGRHVILEVPNRERRVISPEEMKAPQKPLEVPLGVACGGEQVLCDIAQMSHLLMAGATATGKSVLINNMLVSLMQRNTPETLRIALIDPKRVEFTSYVHAPHLLMPVINEPADALAALEALILEMEHRYNCLKDMGVWNIEAYNRVIAEDPDREHLPYILIVIDELADLKLFYDNRKIDSLLIRLAQRCCPVGMHLIIATQRPNAEVLSSALKCNIPSRIAFRVVQESVSHAILDISGAERLIGCGDLLYLPVGATEPIRLQSPYISDSEVEAAIGALPQSATCYDRRLMERMQEIVERNRLS